jgi:hypothetical protein
VNCSIVKAARDKESAHDYSEYRGTTVVCVACGHLQVAPPCQRLIPRISYKWSDNRMEYHSINHLNVRALAYSECFRLEYFTFDTLLHSSEAHSSHIPCFAQILSAVSIMLKKMANVAEAKQGK